MARRSLSELMRTPPDVDWERIGNTTEADIRRQARADGDDPDEEPEGYLPVPSARDLRRALDMTQAAFATLLRVPIGTVRNWEQGRTPPDPAARTLLMLVAADPKHALSVLGRRAGGLSAGQSRAKRLA
ncbi:helix-turn-helix domain-containing protein [Methylobacterium trifolii]|uniref:HTH cro/C1-type domain-containing protein n=1 Tax=Methylobacterium trifolii TaxID=1003092 RepID=A0ABQ4TY71_9HYPH|nr:helix-turn-helix domain-containing protein [Methylobacterium trifolii]GJE58815.1 hypothetical protein MPOCJGCO_0899 [Methylobacterium trifolii]